MALTYELELDEIGVGSTFFDGLTTSDLALVSLLVGTDYRARVRAIDTTNGITVYSIRSPWATFTTTVPLEAKTVTLGHISHSVVLNALTAVIPPQQITTLRHELELTETGQVPVLFTDLANSDYALTGLTPNTEHTTRARLLKTINGAEYKSLWSPAATFTTSAALNPITVVLGHISHAVTLNSLTPVIPIPQATTIEYQLELTEEGQSPVLITGVTNSEYVLTGLTGSTNYSLRVKQFKTVNGVIYQSLWSAPVAFTSGVALTPITVTLGHINHSVTLNSVTPRLPTVVDNSGISHWKVEVFDVSTELSVLLKYTLSSEFPLTNLPSGKTLRLEVSAYAFGSVSEPSVALFTTDVNDPITMYEDDEQPLEMLYLVSTNYTVEQDTIRVTGVANQDLTSSLVTSSQFKFLQGHIDSAGFTNTHLGGSLQTYLLDELDGFFEINSGLNNEPIGIM